MRPSRSPTSELPMPVAAVLLLGTTGEDVEGAEDDAIRSTPAAAAKTAKSAAQSGVPAAAAAGEEWPVEIWAIEPR